MTVGVGKETSVTVGVIVGRTVVNAAGEGVAAGVGIVPQPAKSKARAKAMITSSPLLGQEAKDPEPHFSPVTATGFPGGTGWRGAALLPPAAGPASGGLSPPTDHIGDGKQLLQQRAAALGASGRAAA